MFTHAVRRLLPAACLLLGVAAHASAQWTAVSPLPAPGRTEARAVTLSDGRVLVGGGIDTTYTNSAFVYDSAMDTWTPVPMGTARSDFVLVGLQSGKVLAAGGRTALT